LICDDLKLIYADLKLNYIFDLKLMYDKLKLIYADLKLMYD